MVITSPARSFSFERTSIVFIIDNLDVVSQFSGVCNLESGSCQRVKFINRKFVHTPVKLRLVWISTVSHSTSFASSLMHIPMLHL